MDGSTPELAAEYLAHGSISPKPGFNPRRKFDPAALQSLAESIRQQGVIQAVVVRPRDDGVPGYWLVAGERRWRAAGMAGLERIPAIIRNLTDRQAFLLAMHENKDREDITPAEEAYCARRALDDCDGDEAAAAKVLGWSRDKLRSRVLLLHAIPEVLDVAAEKKIALGHAELLATLPDDLQRTVLAKVLEHGVSVDELKRQLAAFTQDLSAAPFDTAACTGCMHNSSTQGALFEYSVGQGRCSNKACWGDKTAAVIAQRKASLATEYPMVFLDTEKDPALYTRVSAAADGAVGEEQYQQGCRGCAKFGAVICTRPGKEAQVAASICFDLTCNAQKRRDFAAAQAPAASATAAPAGKAQAAEKPASGKARPKASMSAAPRAVTDHIDTFLRETAAEVSGQSARVRRAVEVYALRNLLGNHGGGSTVGRKFDPILKMTNEEMDAECARLIAKLLSEGKSSGYGAEQTQWAAASARLLTDAGTEFAGRFKLTRDFLDAHTKAGLEALLASAAFHESLDGENDDAKAKALKKLVAGKHGDIVNAALRSKHDFSKFVPPSVEARVKALRKE